MRRSLFISCGCFIIATVLYRISTDVSDQNNDDQNVNAVYTVNYADAKTFDSLGRLTRNLEADKIHYFAKNDFFTFEAPSFTNYEYKQNGAMEIWQIRGNFGEVKHNQWTKIQGSVVLTPLFAGAQIQKVDTEELVYDFKTRRVTAPDKVAIQGFGWTNSGYGFEADIDKKTMVFKGGAHAIYDPNIPPHSHVPR